MNQPFNQKPSTIRDLKYGDLPKTLPPGTDKRAFDSLPPDVARKLMSVPSEKIYKNSGSNFYWIAGLSLINSLIVIFDQGIRFLAGLGITQLIDTIAYSIGVYRSDLKIVAQGIGLVLDITICAVFVLLGFLTARQHRWPLIVGLVFYGLDALLALYFKDFIGAGIHLIFIVPLLSGLRVINYLHRLKAQDAVISS